MSSLDNQDTVHVNEANETTMAQKESCTELSETTELEEVKLELSLDYLSDSSNYDSSSSSELDECKENQSSHSTIISQPVHETNSRTLNELEDGSYICNNKDDRNCIKIIVYDIVYHLIIFFLFKDGNSGLELLGTIMLILSCFAHFFLFSACIIEMLYGIVYSILWFIKETSRLLLKC